MLINHKDLLVTSKVNEFISHDNLDENSSMLTFALESINETHNEIRAILSEAYGNDSYILNEGNFKASFERNFSFGKIVTFIIESAIKIITSIYKKFKYALLRFNFADRTIIDYKDKIKQWGHDGKAVTLDFGYYNYTYLDASVPPIGLDLRFKEENLRLQDKLIELSQDGNTLIKLQKYKNELINDEGENYCNKLRASALENTNAEKFNFDNPSINGISADQYQNKLFATFRDGALDPQKDKIIYPYVSTNGEAYPDPGYLNILATYVDGSIRIGDIKLKDSIGIKNLKDMIKDIESQQKSLENAAANAKREISRTKIEDVVMTYNSNSAVQAAYNDILNYKCAQLSKACDIYVMAYSAKITAINDSIVQYKKILYAVVHDIIVKGAQS